VQDMPEPPRGLSAGFDNALDRVEGGKEGQFTRSWSGCGAGLQRRREPGYKLHPLEAKVRNRGA